MGFGRFKRAAGYVGKGALLGTAGALGGLAGGVGAKRFRNQLLRYPPLAYLPGPQKPFMYGGAALGALAGMGAAYGAYKGYKRYRRSRAAPAAGQRSGGLKTYKAPASMAVAAGGITPMVSMRGETKIISGQELIVSSITSASSGWQINPRVDINPISPLMPILAAEASSYQMYRFTKLEAQYENLCPSSTQGQLFMGTLADPADALPDSAQDATAIKNSVRNAMWVPSSFKFPCDGQFRYVDGSIATDADQRNINQFSFWYGTLGFGPTTTSAGTIRLNYTIELQKRIAPVAPGVLNVTELDGASGVAILPGLRSYITNRRRGSWYRIEATTQRLVHQAPGKYALQLSIRSRIDQEVWTPLTTMTIRDVNGTAITPTIGYQVFGYGAPGWVNRSLATRVYTYSLADPGGYIDFSFLAGLTDIDLTISIDRL